MFRQTRTVAFTRLANCTFQRALEVLHNPAALIDLNPLVVHREQSATDPSVWNIRDDLSLLGLKYSIDFVAKATPLENGTAFVITAPLGVVLNTRWTVSKTEGGVEVKEEVTVHANFLLMPMTLGDLQSSHQVIHNRLAALMEKRSVDASQAQQTSEQPDRHYVAIILSLLSALMAYVLLQPGWMRTAVFTVHVATAPFVLQGVVVSYKDPYGSFHLALNRADDETSEKMPETEWLNMGYWKDTQSFPKACEALALKLLWAAECEPGGNVLDVGHGSGDSLLLHLRHSSVPRPSRLTGITSLKAHHARSLERVQALGADNVTLYNGDAVYRPSAEHPNGEQHPLDPSSSLPPYTTVLALDCAYHFRTRHEFLAQSYERLKIGGKIALADICFSSEPTAGFGSGIVKWAIGLLGVMPKANIVTTEQYVQDLRTIGFQDVLLEDITEDVFPGFGRFLAKRGGAWRLFGDMIGWLSAGGAQFVIVSGKR